jgi:hypothetical protein
MYNERGEGHRSRVKEEKQAQHTIFFGTLKIRYHFGGVGLSFDKRIVLEIDVKEIGYEQMDLIHLAQDRFQL